MIKLKAVVAAVKGHTFRMAQPGAGVSLGTLSMIKNKGESKGLTLEQMDQMSEEELTLIVYGSLKPDRPLPDFEKVRNLLSINPKITLKQIFRKYKQSVGENAYSYERFCSLFRKWREVNEPPHVQSNLRCWPAQYHEIDFSGDKIKYRDFQGVEHECDLFVAADTYSGKIFAYATEDQTQASWIEAIIASFEADGGVCSILVFDNAKALVKKVTKDGSVVQEAILVLCRHYNMEPKPCPPRAPRCKAKVEFSVGLVQTEILAAKDLEGGFIAADRADLNRQLAQCVEELNNRKMTRSEISRNDRFAEGKIFMGPLPPTRYEIGEWRYATADKRHCVLITGDGNHRYSVPPDYAGRKVCIHILGDRVKIYGENSAELIGDHLRRTDPTGEKTHLLPEHMTAREKYSRMSRQDILEAIVALGVDRKTVEEYSALAWQNPRQGRRICQAALRACKTYKASSIEWAMKKCIAAQMANNRCLCKLAKEFENREQLKGQPSADYHTPEHSNIRGNYE